MLVQIVCASNWLGAFQYPLRGMDMEAAVWSGLPPEIVERVLAFVPVPDLCRFRAVCRPWNCLITDPGFAAAHASQNAESPSFIVMSCSRRFKDSQTRVSGKKNLGHLNRWCILDVTARRWYAVDYNDRYRFKGDCDIMAMDRGLVCQYLETKAQTNSVIVHNPIARTARVLPVAPDHVSSLSFPELSLVADPQSATFKVVLLNHSFNDTETLDHPGLPPEARSLIQNDPLARVYSSATNEWTSLGNPPWLNTRVGHIRRSIMFEGLLYVLSYGEKQYHLWRYNLADDLWERLPAPISSDFKYPDLVVTSHRLFLAAWYCRRFSLTSDGSLQNQRRWFYKVFEIKLPGVARETVFDHSRAKMVSMFRDVEGHEAKYMRISVFGFGRCLLFMSNASGKAMTFDVVTRTWDREWPRNPIGYKLPDEDCSWVGEHMSLLLPSMLW